MKSYLFKEMYEMEETYWWHKAKRAHILSLLKRYLGNGKDKSVLDVGCGTGYFLKELDARYQACGLDYSRHCLGYTKRRGLKNLTLLNIEKSNFPRKRFDGATLLDVIEHIENDSQAMKNINRSLKPGGILIVATPAFQGLWTYWDELAGHFRRYNRGQLIKLFKKSGFKVEFIRFANILPLFPALLIRVFRNNFKKAGRSTSDFIKVPWIVNKILYWLMRVEAFVSFYLPIPFGLSLVAVGRKVKQI